MEELLKKLGLSIARGVPQMATGFVDLAALPFTMSGLLEPEQAFGSTAYLTERGLLPPPQEGVIPETLEMLAGAMSPGGMATTGLLSLGTIAGMKGAGKLGEKVTDFSELAFDPRFDKRIKEQDRLKQLTTTVDQTANLDVPVLSLADFEGFPFITSMSDRTAGGGFLTSINDVDLKRPVNLEAGQDYMFTNPGQVWASAQAGVTPIMRNAQMLKQVTGRDPLFIPERMAPSGGDFATMTGETMLAYAESALPKSIKKAVDKEIRAISPSWKGLDSPESISQFQKFPDKQRKAIKNALDTKFRNEGGLSIGEARLAVADTKQLAGQDGGIMNIGRIFSDQPMIMQSGHTSYPRGVPGEGLGRSDKDLNIFHLLEEAARQRNIPDVTNPRQTDLRALQMKPYAGILDERLLKSLGY